MSMPVLQEQRNKLMTDAAVILRSEAPTADQIDISLALSNRLANLQRASNRRYTTADQHIDYPDDTGFVWVEVMNDLAVDWGG